jgi:hypothetical protein
MRSNLSPETNWSYTSRTLEITSMLSARLLFRKGFFHICQSKTLPKTDGIYSTRKTTALKTLPTIRTATIQLEILT